MGLEVSGRLHAIFDTAQVSERFTKREFVVELADNPKYPQLVQFQLTGDRVSQLDAFQIGDEVTIEFSLRGREWKSPRGEVKYFNSLDVWRIDAGRSASAGGGRRDSQGRGDSRGDSRGRAAAPPRGRAVDPRDGDAPPPLSDDDRPYGGGSRELDDDLPF